TPGTGEAVLARLVLVDLVAARVVVDAPVQRDVIVLVVLPVVAVIAAIDVVAGPAEAAHLPRVTEHSERAVAQLLVAVRRVPDRGLEDLDVDAAAAGVRAR